MGQECCQRVGLKKVMGVLITIFLSVTAHQILCMVIAFCLMMRWLLTIDVPNLKTSTSPCLSL